MSELITAVYKRDHSALLACATLSRSMKPDSGGPNLALLYRNQEGIFSLAESVELNNPGDNHALPRSYWRSLADALISPSHPQSLHEVPRGGAAILMLVEDHAIREKALAILRSFGGRERMTLLTTSSNGTR